MRLLISALVMLFCLSGPLSEAGLSSKLDLELRLQEKIRSVVLPADPDVQVMVSISLREVSTPLPGTGTYVSHFTAASSAQGIDLEELEFIEIKVLSDLNPFPEKLKDLLIDVIHVKPDKKRFVFEKREKIEKKLGAFTSAKSPFQEKVSDEMTRFNSKWEDFVKSVYVSSGILAALLLVFFIWSGHRAKSLSEQSILQASKEVEGLLDRFQGMQSQSPLPTSETAPRQTSGEREHQEFESMPNVALAALLADCYWCKEDGYAAWIWQQLSPSQRSEVVETSSLDPVYFESLGKAAPKKLNYHSHPYYLRPVLSTEVSQEDLMQWLKKHPQAWHWISPIRQAKATLTLKEKLAFSSTTRLTSAPKMPGASTEKRKVKGSIEVGTITDSDEEMILQDPASVPREYRRDILSLAWVAALPIEQRGALLATMTATQLASGWVGSENVLKKISEVVPEKKMKLIQEYALSMRPSRSSSAVQYLTEEALKLFETTHIDEDPISSQAS